MKLTSLNAEFIPPREELRRRVAQKRIPSGAEAVKQLAAMPFNDAFDVMRLRMARMVSRDETALALKIMAECLTAAEAVHESSSHAGDIYSALLTVTASLHIEGGNYDEALVSAAAALNTLAQEARRKDEPFMLMLGCLLYDMAIIHSERTEFKQAEREVEKALKIFEKLAKTAPERYGAPHIAVIDLSTSVYRSREKQVNMLAHCQVATSTYLELVKEGGGAEGIEKATDHLIESLTTEGRTLVQMGRHREAVQYFTRALKFLTKIKPEMDLRQLHLSIDLGQALVNVPASRDKGVHLLNTMLHKATKLNAADDHRRIVDILLNAKSRRLDILGIWHKVFPK